MSSVAVVSRFFEAASSFFTAAYEALSGNQVQSIHDALESAPFFWWSVKDLATESGVDTELVTTILLSLVTEGSVNYKLCVRRTKELSLHMVENLQQSGPDHDTSHYFQFSLMNR